MVTDKSLCQVKNRKKKTSYVINWLLGVTVKARTQGTGTKHKNNAQESRGMHDIVGQA